MRNKNKGFTLIELLVVISIIGILAAVVLVNLSNARTKAREARALADMKQLSTALELMYNDTARLPGGSQDTTPCVDPGVGGLSYVEVYLDTCTAGLECTDGNFTNWGGPYVANVSLDPWGSSYLFDPDYHCHPNIRGCEGVPDDERVRVLASFGPNKVGLNLYDNDDIVLLICK